MPMTMQQQTQQIVTELFTSANRLHRQSSSSTNAELIELIKSAQLDHNQIHLLTASRQSRGRGQHGRQWQSPLGNVYLSLYYPIADNNRTKEFRLSGLLSLCIGYQLSQLPIIKLLNTQRQQKQQKPIGVKWVNDIGFYTHSAKHSFKNSLKSSADDNAKNDHDTNLSNLNKSTPIFHKLAGILIEPVQQQGRLIGIVIGVGFNVEVAPTISTTHEAKGITSQSVCLNDLLNDLSNNLSDDLSKDLSDKLFNDNLTGQLVKQLPTANQPTKQPLALTASQLYQPITSAIIQAILTYQQIIIEKASERHIEKNNKRNVKNNNKQNDDISKQVKNDNTEPTNTCATLNQFLQDFSTVNILRKHRIRHLPTNDLSSASSAQALDKKIDNEISNEIDKTINKAMNDTIVDSASETIGEVIAIDSNGSLQILTDDNKLCALCTGSVVLLE